MLENTQFSQKQWTSDEVLDFMNYFFVEELGVLSKTKEQFEEKYSKYLDFKSENERHQLFLTPKRILMGIDRKIVETLGYCYGNYFYALPVGISIYDGESLSKYLISEPWTDITDNFYNMLNDIKINS
jgi:hypothetical protein